MMLYVFHVDVGRMLSFDMTVALSSVENLKETIHRLHGISSDNIVLLASGGEALALTSQVSCYSAGTDTNPIYMFLTNNDDRMPPTLLPPDLEAELRRQIEESHHLPASIETVRCRVQLAQHMYDLARDEERHAERLVHDQHLQQQGWSAVVANMEDLVEEFRQRFTDFCAAFEKHLGRRESFLAVLCNFKEDITRLGRIPILPGLRSLAEADFHGFDELFEIDDVFAGSQVQQESVLKTGDDGTGGIGGASQEDVAAGGDAAAVAVDLSTASVGDDKSTSSTSPNKKQKLGDDIVATVTLAATSTVEDQQERISQGSTSSSSRRILPNLSLLQWITSKESDDALKIMSDECVQVLSTFNDEIFESLKQDGFSMLRVAEQGEVKEIKGLGDRLCKLEEFKYRMKKLVQDQKELSSSFQQNQARAMNVREHSILSDLCASHQSQLLVMLQNHQRIRELARCIARAKDELGKNLNMRLKRIVYVENGLSEFDNRQLFYHRCLRRAERHIDIIEQIHRAPCIYMAAVTEVVRRKIFSTEFRLWASKLAIDFDSIHGEEIRRRQEFNASFEGHFLNILFPGMNDMPPTFATENPFTFDTRLPNLTKSDLDMLTTHLPDMASEFQLPDMRPVINFFVSRSGPHQKERMEELLKQQMNMALNMMDCMPTSSEKQQPLQHQRLGELQKQETTVTSTGGGCDESETDTETEFEKVAQPSATTINVATSTSASLTAVEMIARSTTTDLPLPMHSVETLTEENESTVRAEVERLRDLINAMSKLVMDCLHMARANLANIRLEATTQRDDLCAELQTLNEKWNLIRMECESRELQRQEDFLHMAEVLSLRENELAAQREEMDRMTMKCATLEMQVELLRQRVEDAEEEKERALADERETLIHEHKCEIESLRCRFKLMTSMEHSPSDTSLEKLERPMSSASEQNVIDVQQHEQLLAQQRTELEAQRERAINSALELERSIWQSKIFPSQSVMANVGVLNDMLKDKERQLDMLREQDKILSRENYQLKIRIETLTDEEGNSWLKEKIDYLNKDKCRLEEELNAEKSRRIEMESSFAALKCSNVEPQLGMGLSRRLITLENCAKNDLVIVVWSIRHKQFVVVQDSSTLYFVHNDSLAGLNLSMPQPTIEMAEDLCDIIPVPYYGIGRVLDKEYCQARKDENRYRVNKGSKFYRIKLSPFVSRVSARRERLESESLRPYDYLQRHCVRNVLSALTGSISRPLTQPSDAQSDAQKPTVEMAASTITVAPTPSPTPMSVPMVATTEPAIASAGKTANARDVAIGLAVALAQSTSATNSGGSLVSAAGNSLYQSFKERTISITSINEDDDESTSLVSERCRYISVSEEDEMFGGGANVSTIATAFAGSPLFSTAITTATTAAAAAVVTTSQTQGAIAETGGPTVQQQQQQQPQSVITEQPTSSCKLNFEFVLGSADTLLQNQQSQQDMEADYFRTGITSTLTSTSEAEAFAPLPTFILPFSPSTTPPPPLMDVEHTEKAATHFPLTRTSIGALSEDSDEFRSFETKEYNDSFFIPE